MHLVGECIYDPKNEREQDGPVFRHFGSLVRTLQKPSEHQIQEEMLYLVHVRYVQPDHRCRLGRARIGGEQEYECGVSCDGPPPENRIIPRISFPHLPSLSLPLHGVFRQNIPALHRNTGMSSCLRGFCSRIWGISFLPHPFSR